MTSSATTTGYVTSRDGTRIGFLQQGTGPGIVLVQGAMADAHSYHELAEALSPSFTVYSADRRGRGLSARPYDSKHDISRDVEDIDAILAETGAGYIFGLSSGAVITLKAAQTLDRVRKAAVFEPPFYADGISHEAIARLNAEIERGELGTALIDSILTSGTAPSLIRVMPRPLARLLGRVVLGVDARSRSSYAKLRDLLPGVRYDFNVVGGMDGKIDDFGQLDKPVLLLSGTRSPLFLRQSAETLLGILPDSRHIEFDGLGHNGPWNTTRGGQPHTVAAALGRFFS